MKATIGSLVVLLAVVSGSGPAVAGIDMTGKYEAVEFPCHWNFVQTGTALQVTGTCTPQAAPLSLAGTIDSATGAFTVAGQVTGACAASTITGTADGEMFTGHYTCDAGSGSVTGTKCLNGIIDPGEDCQDGNVLDGDCCSSRCRFEATGSACASDRNACTDDVCDGAGTCLHQPNTAACDDGNACTVGDVCAGGTCTSGTPVTGSQCSATGSCEAMVARALSACIVHVGAKAKQCYLNTGAACSASDPRITRMLAKLATKIGAKCPDAATVQAIGYGANATPATVIARAKEACTGEVASIVARTFGGPQGAVLAAADEPTRGCLSAASSSALKVVKQEVNLRAKCIVASHGLGKSCDVARTNAAIATAESDATATVAAKCPNLTATIGLDATTYVERAAAQARCATATAHGNSGPLALDCGGRFAIAVPPRDTWTQVVLDEATYGTRCGDGSPYAFWLRLPPAGSPSEKVVIDAQGGGGCYFETDCAAKPAYLFNATDDAHPTTGILSTSPADNPFSDWTMVFLPYCTQDVHIGGGATEVFPSITVRRFGAINLRAALRYVRDVLWQDLGETEPEGYRPDRLTVIFGGESAGGFAVDYNYHYVLDDLRWVHTTAVPDSGLGLDNGQVVGVRGLGEVKATAWGSVPYLPPYCFDPACSVGPVLQAATSLRLKAVPEQQILNVSNQVDDVQVDTTFFATTVDWINAARAAYCANRGLKGIRDWLPARSAPFHQILTANPSLWPSVTAAGETLPMFLADAIANPDGVTDHVDEGTLVTDYPGVNPIPCL